MATKCKVCKVTNVTGQPSDVCDSCDQEIQRKAANDPQRKSAAKRLITQIKIRKAGQKGHN